MGGKNGISWPSLELGPAELRLLREEKEYKQIKNNEQRCALMYST